MGKESAMDRLISTICGDDEKRFEELAKGLVMYKNVYRKINEALYSEFKGTTRKEFEEWKEERALNYHMVSNAYKSLKFRGDSWI